MDPGVNSFKKDAITTFPFPRGQPLMWLHAFLHLALISTHNALQDQQCCQGKTHHKLRNTGILGTNSRKQFFPWVFMRRYSQ